MGKIFPTPSFLLFIRSGSSAAYYDPESLPSWPGSARSQRKGLTISCGWDDHAVFGVGADLRGDPGGFRLLQGGGRGGSPAPPEPPIGPEGRPLHKGARLDDPRKEGSGLREWAEPPERPGGGPGRRTRVAGAVEAGRSRHHSRRRGDDGDLHEATRSSPARHCSAARSQVSSFARARPLRPSSAAMMRRSTSLAARSAPERGTPSTRW